MTKFFYVMSKALSGELSCMQKGPGLTENNLEALVVALHCCFTSTVNIYGHVGMVS